MQDFERLGVFYLGRQIERGQDKAGGDLLLYDSKDLTTHAVIVGMTGSGKTGLGVGILEEAAIDGIPSIVIDPKGDMGNLLLTFPGLRAADFAPWIDAGEAVRQGMAPGPYAEEVASRWKKGLADWGQDGARIRRFQDAAEATIYTPGSNAGVPLSILRSFDAPGAAVLGDADAMRERVTSTVSGLLALLGVEADPIRSREHMLLSNVLSNAWRQGKSLDLAALIREVQQPSFDKVGVMDLESFYPSKDRFGLAMSLNGLLASPGFSAWTEGEPLDVARLLWTPEGKPRISVLSISHLGDAERMFFVTTLLNEIVAWVRAQPGTSSLRALLYMDEVFGYFPPSANPPSKMPMLTLLKQARAFGLGIVLSTQNPVDLDYKGLSNAGTWFLGRLQTERDKMRVLEGLEGASSSAGAAFDKGKMEATLAGLGKRTFLMNSVHEDQPVLFQTRWALSYLRGPLTRVQIQKAMEGRGRTAPPTPSTPPVSRAPAATGAGGARPVVPTEIPERFASGSGTLAPRLLGLARLHYADKSTNVDVWESVAVSAEVPQDEEGDPWAAAEVIDAMGLPGGRQPDAKATFAPLSAVAMRAKSYDLWAKSLKDWLYRARPLSVFRAADLKESSRAGESEGEFRSRLTQRIREQRDVEVEALRRKYAPKVQAIQDRIRMAQDRVEREKSQYSQAKVQTGISFGATILGALFGRKKISVSSVGRATTAARGLGRSAREKADVDRAEESVGSLQQRLKDLQQDVEAEIARVRDAADPTAIPLDRVEIPPRKGDLAVESLGLIWV